MSVNALESFKKLKQYCEDQHFMGWDPYDGLNSSLFQQIPLLPKKRLARLIWIQGIKKLPLNLRPLLRIKKGLNPKGLALFLSGYAALSKDPCLGPETNEKISWLADNLINLKTNGFSGNCWGYNFDWESRAFFQPKFTPTIVVTTYAANALIDAYEATGKEYYLRSAIDSKEFILKDLKRTYGNNGNFAFSYSPFDQTSVFNASLLGARLLSRIYSYTKETELLDLARKAIAYCIDFQNSDGSWFYSTLPFHQWIDSFHTGFNLECISAYASISKDNGFSLAFKKGMDYYLTTFFDPKGRSKYYNNSTYPIDIHAPSQLIITLFKAGLFESNMDLIDRVLSWTIKHMQSSKGYFYFQKRKLYTNTIPYMRWSQGWMFYALALYTNKMNTDRHENMV
jgi:rhamnogalacturonyl hydrolase YesR